MDERLAVKVGTVVCGFCGKNDMQVRSIVTAGQEGPAICNGCIIQALEVLIGRADLKELRPADSASSCRDDSGK